MRLRATLPPAFCSASYVSRTYCKACLSSPIRGGAVCTVKQPSRCPASALGSSFSAHRSGPSLLGGHPH